LYYFCLLFLFINFISAAPKPRLSASAGVQRTSRTIEIARSRSNTGESTNPAEPVLGI